ncbi:MAG TPA: hypothetical protein VMU27_03415 [Candidatus Paceibacterota bacterium]|nr:hypothetical protein [Candidatus Paceibacterota bacterium]
MDAPDTLLVICGTTAVILIILYALAIRWTSRGFVRVWYLLLALPAFGLAIGSPTQLMGLAKPVSLEWLKNKAMQADVLAYYFEDGKAIDLLLLVEGDKTPTFYSIPWKEKTAQNLQDAWNQGKKNGTGIVMQPLPFGGSDGVPKFLKNLLRIRDSGGTSNVSTPSATNGTVFRVIPVPRPPPKLASPPGKNVDRPHGGEDTSAPPGRL